MEAVLSYEPSSTTGKGSSSHKTSQEPLPPSQQPEMELCQPMPSQLIQVLSLYVEVVSLYAFVKFQCCEII